MVKTKQGGKGKTAVNYTFNAEFSQPTKLLKKTRGYDYAYNQMLAGINDGLDEADLPFNQEVLDIIKISQILIHPDTPIQIGWEKD